MVKPTRCLRLARCLRPARSIRRQRVVQPAAIVILACFALPVSLLAQAPGVHYLHQGIMPPGAIGRMQLARGGPVAGFFQPVELRAPKGTSISLAEEGGFTQLQPAPVKAGLLIGQVYRLRVTGIPFRPGMEVFPTVEVIDRLYAPRGQEQRFPIIVELSEEDLSLAVDGKFVTRVIYLEDPYTALPVPEDPSRQSWFEAGPGHDPLAVADQLGRPMAILRMGARLPDHAMGPDMSFLFGCPPLKRYEPGVKVLPRPPKVKPAGAVQIRTPAVTPEDL